MDATAFRRFACARRGARTCVAACATCVALLLGTLPTAADAQAPANDHFAAAVTLIESPVSGLAVTDVLAREKRLTPETPALAGFATAGPVRTVFTKHRSDALVPAPPSART